MLEATEAVSSRLGFSDHVALDDFVGCGFLERSHNTGFSVHFEINWLFVNVVS